MLAERPAVDVRDLTGAVGETSVALEEARPVRARQEAEVLRVGLGGDREPGVGRDPPDLGLGQLPEREAHARQGLRRERRQHVGLVLGRIGGGAQQRAALLGHDACVVAGGEGGAAETLGELQHRI